MRGHALEQQFGRRLYDDTATLARRASTDPERKIVQQELLAIALQFELVTELTSRVAIERQVSRAAAAPLKTQHVAQYAPGDQTGGDVIVLSPFTVDAEDEGGSYTSSSAIAGTRLRSDLRDGGSSITVVTAEFLANSGALTKAPHRPMMKSGNSAKGEKTAMTNGSFHSGWRSRR